MGLGQRWCQVKLGEGAPCTCFDVGFESRCDREEHPTLASGPPVDYPLVRIAFWRIFARYSFVTSQ
jgi:hypothetical protein